jgi:hypothetical protein
MMIRAIFLQPLGPVLLLSLGGLLLWLSYRLSLGPALHGAAADTALQPVQLRRLRWVLLMRELFALLVLAAALTLLVLLRVRSAQAVLQWTWQPLTVAGSTLLWQFDGWNWLVAVVIVLLTAVALAVGDMDLPVLTVRERPGNRAAWTLWLGAAALTFVLSGNVVTLASGWVLLDGALTLRLRPGESAEPAARAWGLLSLTGLMMLMIMAALGESGIRATFTDGSFGRLDLTLLWLAALVRAGVYPLHFWLTGPGSVDPGGRIALHLIAPTTGLWLLARVQQAIGMEWLRRPEWAALGAFALLGTALLSWTVEDEGMRWRWIALNRASLVVMAAYVSGGVGPPALVWPLVTFSLGSALLGVGQVIHRSGGWRLPLWLGGLALWGVPGTVGFLTRSFLTFPTELALALPLFGIVLVAEVLLAAALWQAVTVPDDSAEPRLFEVPRRDRAPLGWFVITELALAAVLMVVPLIVWGIAPQRLASLVGQPGGLVYTDLLGAASHARRSVWIGLILSGIGGVTLGLFRRRIFSQMRGWQNIIADVVDLSWLYRGIGGGLMLLGSGFRYFASLGEGEGYLGWLILGALVLWVLLRG